MKVSQLYLFLIQRAYQNSTDYPLNVIRRTDYLKEAMK